MNFYPFHIGDYISHTTHLTDEEDLAYRRMIDLYYLTEAPFPNDAAWIARRVRSNPEIVATLLKEFFELEADDLWHSSRADKEIAKFHYLSESGKKGAEKRWGNREEKPTQSTPNSPPITTPIATKTNTKTITNIKPMKAAPSVDIVFEEAWTSYPKRPGASKQGSFKAWKARLKAGVEAQKMLQGVKRYAEYCKASGIDPQFIKQPATFFGPDEHYLADWTPLASQSQPKELPLGTDAQIEHAYRVECGGDPSKARFNSYFEMRKFIVDRREQRKVAA